MGSPLKTIYLKHGGKIEKNFPSNSLVTGIQKGELLASDEISNDGIHWVSLGKHKQLEKYFQTPERDSGFETKKSEKQKEPEAPLAEKILVVEDEPPLFKLLEHALKKDGYRIVWAQNGEEALEFIKTENPDLVITDIMMPYINGLQVLEKAKKDPETSHIPFIILSSKGLGQDIVAGLELGGDDYITKPFNPDEVLLRVKMILKRKDN